MAIIKVTAQVLSTVCAARYVPFISCTEALANISKPTSAFATAFYQSAASKMHAKLELSSSSTSALTVSLIVTHICLSPPVTRPSWSPRHVTRRMHLEGTQGTFMIHNVTQAGYHTTEDGRKLQAIFYLEKHFQASC